MHAPPLRYNGVDGSPPRHWYDQRKVDDGFHLPPLHNKTTGDDPLSHRSAMDALDSYINHEYEAWQKSQPEWLRNFPVGSLPSTPGSRNSRRNPRMTPGRLPSLSGSFSSDFALQSISGNEFGSPTFPFPRVPPWSPPSRGSRGGNKSVSGMSTPFEQSAFDLSPRANWALFANGVDQPPSLDLGPSAVQPVAPAGPQPPSCGTSTSIGLSPFKREKLVSAPTPPPQLPARISINAHILCAGYLSLSGGTAQASKPPVPSIRGIARAKAYRRRPYPMGMLLKTVRLYMADEPGPWSGLADLNVLMADAGLIPMYITPVPLGATSVSGVMGIRQLKGTQSPKYSESASCGAPPPFSKSLPQFSMVGKMLQWASRDSAPWPALGMLHRALKPLCPMQHCPKWESSQVQSAAAQFSMVGKILDLASRDSAPWTALGMLHRALKTLQPMQPCAKWESQVPTKVAVPAALSGAAPAAVLKKYVMLETVMQWCNKDEGPWLAWGILYRAVKDDVLPCTKWSMAPVPGKTVTVTANWVACLASEYPGGPGLQLLQTASGPAIARPTHVHDWVPELSALCPLPYVGLLRRAQKPLRDWVKELLDVAPMPGLHMLAAAQGPLLAKQPPQDWVPMLLDIDALPALKLLRAAQSNDMDQQPGLQTLKAAQGPNPSNDSCPPVLPGLGLLARAGLGRTSAQLMSATITSGCGAVTSLPGINMLAQQGADGCPFLALLQWTSLGAQPLTLLPNTPLPAPAAPTTSSPASKAVPAGLASGPSCSHLAGLGMLSATGETGPSLARLMHVTICQDQGVVPLLPGLGLLSSLGLSCHPSLVRMVLTSVSHGLRV